MVEHRDLYLRSLPSNFLSSLPWLFLSGVGVLAMVNAVFRVFATNQDHVACCSFRVSHSLRHSRGCVCARFIVEVLTSASGVAVRRTFRTHRYEWRSIEQFVVSGFEDSESGVAWAFAEVRFRESVHGKVSMERLPLGGGPGAGDERVARLTQWVAMLNRELETRMAP